MSEEDLSSATHRTDGESSNTVTDPPPSSPLPDDHDVVVFPASAEARRHHADDHHVRFSEARRPPPPPSTDHELMGPILRRKKVVSMPLGAGGDFFMTDDVGGPHRQLFAQEASAAGHVRQQGGGGHYVRTKQMSEGHSFVAATAPSSITHLQRQKTPPTPSAGRVREKQDSSSWMAGIVRRRQVSLDLLGPNDFFAVPTEEPELEPVVYEGDKEEEGEEDEELGGKAEAEGEKAQEEARLVAKKLFRPLRFAPRTVPRHGGGAGHGGAGGSAHGVPSEMPSSLTGSHLSTIDEEMIQSFQRYSQRNEELRQSLTSLHSKAKDSNVSEVDVREQVLTASEHLQKTQLDIDEDEKLLKSKLMLSAAVPMVPEAEEDEEREEEPGVKKEEAYALSEDMNIIRAGRADKIKAAFCALIMLGVTILVLTWETHLNTEIFIHGPVGLACETYCEGDLETKDFFNGHNTFHAGGVIELVMHIDPNPLAEDIHLIAEIVGTETGQIKSTTEFGPPREDERETEAHKIVVDFEDPHEPHVINVYNSNSTDTADLSLSFTLAALVEAPISEHSVIVAAVIMLVVYIFLLFEVIHRMLVAVFGSMVALMFFFIMTSGETESLRQIMLHLEWSTLGLLFGMMVIVGELSHTGIFEWCSVRVLVASRGSFNRLICLLCVLTAFASAFLDNVTTMLLIAPVTIDMCNILEVDPRPYLIGEVLLSNVGGTATLIGDPPNIIIGSSFDTIGFVDFIVNVLPCIFLFCVPASLLAVMWLYRYYLSTEKMKVLDTAKLKEAYPIYDQPRLMIAGTTTFFVILMFFLHSVHHKDVAWIALIGAFVTMAFTNPHDVQDALRNHVEWDVLIFFAGLFVLVEVCAAMGLLDKIGEWLSNIIQAQPEDQQLTVAITLIIWVSSFVSAFLDNIPYTTTMIPVIEIIHEALPERLPLDTLAWALSFGACLGGNGTLLGASANIVAAGISANKGFGISFLNFLYPGMTVMIITVAISNLYMLVRYVWAA